MTPDEVLASVPQTRDENGNDKGSINQQLATWAISQGFQVSMYTFDCQVIDQSWANLSKEKIIERLMASINGVAVPSLGNKWSNAYRESYIEFLNAGGDLQIQPAITSKLLYELLGKGPILPCVCYNTLYGTGKTHNEDNETTIADDVNGEATTHSLVIYGNDADGNFLVADPIHKPGHMTIEPDLMIAAVSTAQIECDNLLFQLSK